jgi:hypothetical protein
MHHCYPFEPLKCMITEIVLVLGIRNVQHTPSRPGIRGTRVKSSGNKNRMSLSGSLDGAYFSEMPPSWHVRPPFLPHNYCELLVIL